MANTQETDIFLRSGAVRRRYGNASDMWLHRRLRDDSGFPQPIVIGYTRYWRLSDLEAWEKQRAISGDAPTRRGNARRSRPGVHPATTTAA